jgi:SOS regulatory protein LexA
MARELTDKQKKVLSTLESYWTIHKVPPSISDLAKQLGINKATAYEHLLALKKKGYLIHQARAGRTWRPAQNLGLPCEHNQVPLIVRFNKSIGLLSTINVDGYIVADHKDPHNLFAMKVTNNRMLNACIRENDIVIVNQKNLFVDNDIVVALIGNREPTINYFSKREGKIRLAYETNAASEFSEFNETEIDILGKVIEVRRIIY